MPPTSWSSNSSLRQLPNFILTGRPSQVVGRDGGHQEELKSRVVVHRDPAIYEDELVVVEHVVADGDHFGREVGRRGRARPHQLPQREIEAAFGMIFSFSNVRIKVLSGLLSRAARPIVLGARRSQRCRRGRRQSASRPRPVLRTSSSHRLPLLAPC